MSDGRYWDETQVEYLQAMGYAILSLHGDDAEEAVAAAPVSPPAPVVSVLDTPIADPNVAVQVPHYPHVAAEPAGVSEARAEAVRSMAPSSALERAVLAATGQTRRSDARAVLAKLEVDMDALRGNAAAKKALWPRLRTLRGQRSRA